MFIATIIAAVSMSFGHVEDNAIKCAIMGSPTKATSMAVEYAGASYPMCCGGCPTAFIKEPTKFIKEASKGEGAIGMFMFCPISGEKLDMKTVKATVDYKGMRYGFCCPDCIETFKKNPAKYTATPEKESLVCAMSGEKITAYSEAAGFMDHDGIRYYTCCGDCLTAMHKDIAKALGHSKAVVTTPKAMNAPKPKA